MSQKVRMIGTSQLVGIMLAPRCILLCCLCWFSALKDGDVTPAHEYSFLSSLKINVAGMCTAVHRTSFFQLHVFYACCPLLTDRLLARENQRERDQILNTVIRSSLGAGSRCAMVDNYSIKSCPVDQLGQYLNSTCSDHSQFTTGCSPQLSSASVQLSLAQLNSKQLLLCLYDLYCHCHIRDIIVRNIHWIKIVQVFNRCSIVISLCRLLSIMKLTFNKGTTSRAHKIQSHKGRKHLILWTGYCKSLLRLPRPLGQCRIMPGSCPRQESPGELYVEWLLAWRCRSLS